MSWATDGQDGNRLQLEKIGPVFFSSLSRCVLENSLKLRLWSILSSEIPLISSSQYAINILCMTKVIRFNLGQL